MRFQVTLIPGQHQFTVADDQTVLDAALAAGVVLPYSCRSGACSTCKGKIVSGEYEAGPYPAQLLTPEDLAAGYTLLCQACPRSDLVVAATEVFLASDIRVRKLPVRVQAVDRVVSDVAVLKLQLPATAETFRFYAGQYIALILKSGQRRSYSIANAPHTMVNESHIEADAPSIAADTASSTVASASPTGSFLELHIRHMPGGLFTDYVFGAGTAPMKVRDILRLEGPFGSFFLREESDKPIILLAAGTGFAPIKAIMEHMIHQQMQRPIWLYWGGRRPQDLYMHTLATSWAETFPHVHYVPVVSDALPEDAWQGRSGWVHEAVMQDFSDLSGYHVYACGTPAMVEAANREFVTQCGLPGDAFYADAFTSAAELAQVHF